MPSDREAHEQRKLAIMKILKGDEPITQQKELVEKLREMGMPATQSSVSRDLSDIGAVRIKGRWMLIGMYDIGLFEGVAKHVTAVRLAGPNNTLLKTQPGAGNLVAQAIDQSEWEEVEGTVAGPNSVLILTHDAFFQKLLYTRLGGYLRDYNNEDEDEQMTGIGWRVSRRFT